jgi:hypothetical protein
MLLKARNGPDEGRTPQLLVTIMLPSDSPATTDTGRQPPTKGSP